MTFRNTSLLLSVLLLCGCGTEPAEETTSDNSGDDMSTRVATNNSGPPQGAGAQMSGPGASMQDEGAESMQDEGASSGGAGHEGQGPPGMQGAFGAYEGANDPTLAAGTGATPGDPASAGAGHAGDPTLTAGTGATPGDPASAGAGHAGDPTLTAGTGAGPGNPTAGAPPGIDPSGGHAGDPTAGAAGANIDPRMADGEGGLGAEGGLLAGQDGAAGVTGEGQQQNLEKNDFKPGTADYVVKEVLVHIAKGELEGLEDVISGSATGLAKKLRSADMTETSLTTLQGQVKTASFQNKRQIRAERLYNFKNSAKEILAFKVRKVRGEYRVTSFVIRQPKG